MNMQAKNLGRRAFLKRMALWGGVSVWPGCAGQSVRGPQRPNFLVITSDQQHGGALGFVDPFFETPHLDRLAQEGVLFQNAYCVTPQCSPNRAALYTGLYPHRTGVIGNLDSRGHQGQKIGPLPAGQETVASRLASSGYHTGYFGKWHLGNVGHFRSHFAESDLDGDSHAGAADKAIAYLQARAGEKTTPFALFVNFINPHDVYDFTRLALAQEGQAVHPEVPHPPTWQETFDGKPSPQKQFMTEDQGRIIWGKPDRYWERYRLAYREKCGLFDAQAGRVIECLDALGLSENTVVLVTSDHGDMDTAHRLIFKGPFLYENLIHVPFLVRPPRHWPKPPGPVMEEFVMSTDILPTLCEWAGVPCGDSDGQSLAPWFRGDRSYPRREYVIGQYYNKQSWVNPIRMIRSREYKYTEYRTHGEELYDLREDPGELRNLANDPGYRGRKDELREALRAWRIQHGDTAFDAMWATDRQGRRIEG